MDSRRKIQLRQGKNECDLRKKTKLKGTLEDSHQHREVDNAKRKYSQANLSKPSPRRVIPISLPGRGGMQIADLNSRSQTQL